MDIQSAKASSKRSVKKRSSVHLSGPPDLLEIKPSMNNKKKMRRVVSNKGSRDKLETIQQKVNDLELLGGIDFFQQSRESGNALPASKSIKEERPGRPRLESGDSLLDFKQKKRKTSARPVNKPRKKGPPEFIKSLSAQPHFDAASVNS